MTLKGATKHVCGGKRGNSVVVLIAHSGLPREWCVTKHKFNITSNCWNDTASTSTLPVGFPAANSLFWLLPRRSEQRHINWDWWKLMSSAVSDLFVSRLGRRWSTGVRCWWNDSLRGNIKKALITWSCRLLFLNTHQQTGNEGYPNVTSRLYICACVLGQLAGVSVDTHLVLIMERALGNFLQPTL